MQRQNALFKHDRDNGAGASTANVCLDEPLWPKGPNLRKLTQLCVKVSVACQRAVREKRGGVSLSPSPFDGPGGTRLFRDFERICRGPPLQTLHAIGFLTLFPELEGLAEVGARQHQRRHSFSSFTSSSSPSPGWEYFSHVSHLHQLLHMATQLRNDASDAKNNKYLAHQIALLYQCINLARGESKALKKRIEENFETIKRHTEAPGGSGNVNGGDRTLPPDLRRWVEDLTAEVAVLVRQYPPGMTEKLNPMLRAIAYQQT